MSARSSVHRGALARAAAALVVAVVAVTPTGSAVGTSDYAPCTPTALPALGGTDGEVMWITSSGYYVGGATNGLANPDGSPAFQAAYWTHDGSGYHVHALPDDPLVNDEVLDVNENGRMVDYGFDPASGTGQTWVFDQPTGHWWHLPTLNGDDTRGRRINASGVVAGGGNDQRGYGFATTWSPPYRSIDKLARLGNYGSYAPGINDAGVTVGVVNKRRFTPAYDKTMQHLGAHAYFPLTLPVEWAATGTPQQLDVVATQAETFAVNDAGTVVGAGDLTLTGFTWDALWWDHSQHAHDMGATPGSDLTEARGVSQGGWATGGGFSFETGHGQGFVWTGVGTLRPLPALSGQSGDSNAHAVNDVRRQVGGWSNANDGTSPATVWQCPLGFSTS
jgi:hypothetical protein